MKFFHLSDLHIGLKINNRDLAEDQIYILNQIVEAAENFSPNAVVIAGDIFDKPIPSADAVKIFDNFITDLVKKLPDAKIMIISGNHDSSQRLDIFRNILNKKNIFMIGLPPQKPEDFIEKVSCDDEFGKINFYLLPFVKPSTVKNIFGEEDSLSYNDAIHKLIEREKINSAERNIFVSHQFYLPVGKNAEDVERMENEVVTVGNIDAVDADFFEKFDYVALGHIHKPMKVGAENFRYCGTPLACSVSESGQKKSIILVELKEKNNISIENIELKPLREIKILSGTFEEILQNGCNDYVSLRLTKKVEINSVELQDRLRAAFPNYLEIRPAEEKNFAVDEKNISAENLNPFDLCCEFYPDISDDEKILLQEIMNSVQEM